MPTLVRIFSKECGASPRQVSRAACFPPDRIAEVSRWLEAGHGIIAAGTGWAWEPKTPGQTMANDAAINRIIGKSGLYWAGRSPTPRNGGYQVSGVRVSPCLNASRALAEFRQLAGNDNATRLSLTDKKQCGITLAGVPSLVASSDPMTAELMDLVRSRFGKVIPTRDAPVKMDDMLAAVTVALENRWLLQLPPEKMPAHPAAKAFPGLPTPEAKPSGPVEVVIDPAVPQWTGTGLYALPGQVIRLETAAPDLLGKFVVRIGCHTDELWGLDEWQRSPQITTATALEKPVTAAANPFGGPVFIEVPEKCALTKPVSLRISGAIPMPRFVLGKTTPDEWQHQRLLPAPWAELAGHKLALCVPAEFIRKLDDPAPLMEFWDKVVTADETLAAWQSGDRTSPERIVPDVQISAGYMHSGYPIMTGDDVYATMVDVYATMVDVAEMRKDKLPSCRHGGRAIFPDRERFLSSAEGKPKSGRHRLRPWAALPPAPPVWCLLTPISLGLPAVWP